MARTEAGIEVIGADNSDRGHIECCVAVVREGDYQISRDRVVRREPLVGTDDRHVRKLQDEEEQNEPA